MSENLERCSMEDATHVGLNGQSYFLGSGKVLLAYDEDDRVGISIVDACAFIPVDAFPILGIKPMKERKRKPIEFEFTFGGNFAHPIKAYGKTFRCVEILEEEK